MRQILIASLSGSLLLTGCAHPLAPMPEPSLPTLVVGGALLLCFGGRLLFWFVFDSGNSQAR